MLAILAGISPASIVKPKLINTSTVACVTETVACTATPDSAYIMLFIGSVKSNVIPTPIIPDIKPIMNVSAVRTVSKGIEMYKNEENAVLIITHNTRILENLKVDYVHILVDGKIVKTGDASLAQEIEVNGYSQYK